jgi:hypothetical protein
MLPTLTFCNRKGMGNETFRQGGVSMAGIEDRVKAFIESWPIAKKQLEELTSGDRHDIGKEEIVSCRACSEALQEQEGGRNE